MASTFILCCLALGATVPAAHAPQVQCYGTLREITHQHRLEGRTRIATAMAHPHAYALGALAGLNGEFLVLDGKAYLSRPDHRGGITRSISHAGADSAALLVYSNIIAWHTMRLLRAVTLTALPDTVMAWAKAAGLPPGGAFPFLVEGTVSHLLWHVADGSKLPSGANTHEAHMKAAVHGESEHARAILLGFYSDHDAGVWVHHDSNVHVHVLLPDGLAAHVDDVTLEPGAVFKLPIAW
jgi:acetolactate decarboxylase